MRVSSMHGEIWTENILTLTFINPNLINLNSKAIKMNHHEAGKTFKKIKTIHKINLNFYIGIHFIVLLCVCVFIYSI